MMMQSCSMRVPVFVSPPCRWLAHVSIQGDAVFQLYLLAWYLFTRPLILWCPPVSVVLCQTEGLGPEKARAQEGTRSCLSPPVEGGDGNGESRRRSSPGRRHFLACLHQGQRAFHCRPMLRNNRWLHEVTAAHFCFWLVLCGRMFVHTCAAVLQ